MAYAAQAPAPQPQTVPVAGPTPERSPLQMEDARVYAASVQRVAFCRHVQERRGCVYARAVTYSVTLRNSGGVTSGLCHASVQLP